MVKRGLVVGAMAFVCLAILPRGKAEAVLGIPDEVPAATIVIPLLEAGTSSDHNTLISITNTCSGAAPRILHWEVWDVNGLPVGLSGNQSLEEFEAWVTDFKAILDDATAGDLSQLTDGSFYHGFLTVDLVTAATSLPPTDAAYPFASSNCLKGVTYYVRLVEGAANGISAVHIEGGVSGALDENVRGFYQAGDNREEIDNHARYYAERTTRNLAVVDDPDNSLDAIISRIFLSPALNGSSRIVLWAWGPPAWGAQGPGDGGRGPFTARHRGEDGETVSTQFLELRRVVNIINITGTENGEIWIEGLPENFNVYAFSFNSAEGDASQTWEVMFPSTIVPE